MTTILPSSVPEDSAAPSGIADPMQGKGAVDRIYGFMRGVPVWVLWMLVIVWTHPDARVDDQLVPAPRPAALDRAGGRSSASSTS